MKAIDYLLCQMELEGIRRIAEDLISRCSPEVDEFPLVLCAHTAEGECLVYMDETLPGELRGKLPINDLAAFKTEAAVEVFERYRLRVQDNHFRTYIFPDHFKAADTSDVKCFDQDDPRVIEFGFGGLADKVYAIEEDGHIISACASSRQNCRCGEAWVYTHPDHRRKGLARRAVTAWAADLLREGMIPFYSHSVENIHSAGLAMRLKLMHVFDEVVIERVRK